MTLLRNFVVVNPEPTDPLSAIITAHRGVIVSTSFPRSHAAAVQAAIGVARLTGRPLVAVDAPALHHEITYTLTHSMPTLAWRVHSPHELMRRPDLVDDECVLFADHACAVPTSPPGRALVQAIRSCASAVVVMRHRDLEMSPEVVEAAGGPVIDLDAGRTSWA